MREAVIEPPAPTPCRIGAAENGPHPDFAVTHLRWAGRHVVCPQIEGPAARDVETGVVPVAGQRAVLHAAAIQRKAHMRTTIVERENTTLVVDDEHRTMRAVHDQPAPSPSTPRGCARARNPWSMQHLSAETYLYDGVYVSL